MSALACCSCMSLMPPTVTRSLPCHVALRLIECIDLSGSCRTCCKCIHLESSFPVSFMLMLQSHFTRGHSTFAKYLKMKFKICPYYICPNKQELSIHMHMENAVLLVWGSLVLAQIKKLSLCVSKSLVSMFCTCI